MTNQTPTLPPGFRFHPTDEELILYYLCNRSASSPCPVSIIAEVNIYKFDPWDLPDKAMFGDKEWYFFSPRDRKYPNGARPNRAAASGYWKATGTDKPITSSKGNENIGVKKALVFYTGKPPRGIKTNWIMHEYRLSESSKNEKSHNIRPVKLRDSSMRLDDWVLCRIYQKSNHLQEAESSVSCIQNTEQDNSFKMHKSFSLSELLNEADISLLSRLLDAATEDVIPAMSNLNQSFVNMHQFSETERSVSAAAENRLKRQRTADDGGSCFSPAAKKSNSNSWINYANFGNQFDSQPFLNWGCNI